MLKETIPLGSTGLGGMFLLGRPCCSLEDGWELFGSLLDELDGLRVRKEGCYTLDQLKKCAGGDLS
jgi:hypothetical protein